MLHQEISEQLVYPVMLNKRTFCQLTMSEILSKTPQNSKESPYFKSCTHKQPSKNVEAVEIKPSVNPGLCNK